MRSHEIDGFECGKEPLYRFLKQCALVNQKVGTVQTYVICRDAPRVLGYYSLAVGGVEAKDDETRAWYERFDFEPSPTDHFHLFPLLKDLRAALAG